MESLVMPNDAKLGLVVGVALVITVAVIFFRKDAPANPAATNVQPAPAATPAPPTARRAALARTTDQTSEEPIPGVDGRCHTVQEGETLSSLAQRYYGDGDKSSTLYQVNRTRLDSPDQLPPGTVLLIPDLPVRRRGP
jgi:nucleoid-associated protein YgaU